MEAVFGAASLLDISIRWGNKLYEVCKSYKNAEQEFRETLLKIEGRALDIKAHLKFLREVWSTLDGEYQRHYQSRMPMLETELKEGYTLVDKTFKPGKGGEKLRGGKYASQTKQKLISVLKGLDDWNNRAQLSLLLLARQPDPRIDQNLASSRLPDNPALRTLKEMRKAIRSMMYDISETDQTTVLLPRDQFSRYAREARPLGCSSTKVWSSTDGTSSYLVDTQIIGVMPEAFCKLAKILRTTDMAEFGILKCSGVLDYERQFFFFIPSHLKEPRSLRKMLLTNMAATPLDDRLSLAKDFSRAAMFMHSARYVHKNIRPETIIVLKDSQGHSHAVLTGFKFFRLHEADTVPGGDNLWEANLYRHPTRQGPHPEYKYSMQHDIYALGVCLLEIGMGDSLVLYDNHDKPRMSSLLSERIEAPATDASKRAFAIKRALVKIAEDVLPLKMGRRYKDAVVMCLKCLDETDNSFGDESQLRDENGILVGVRFIEKILESLLNLNL